jgi:phosphohistidine phosphatase
MAGTKRLFLLRHAKSSWDDSGLDDHERPLAPRGRRAAKVMADYVRREGIHPTLVLCSPSRRTRETLEGVDPGGEVLIEDELYSAGVQDLIERLHRVPEHVDSVMVIGHNPALQALVLRLSAPDGDANGAARLREVKGKFPTGAMATLEFDGAWSDLAPRRAHLLAFVRPKALGRV